MSISGQIIDFLGEIYVDNMDLIITRLKYSTPLDTLEGLHTVAWAWASSLHAASGVINPKKSWWIYAGYTWKNSIWEYAPQLYLSMEIPLSDGSAATISQGEVSMAEKALGVWSTVDGNNKEHLAQNVNGCVRKWIAKMRNEHLPARLDWVACKFKLWPGIRYGLTTLPMLLEIATSILQQENFHLSSFLGVNQNVKREWRTLHHTFGGIGLYSLVVKHTITMINMIVQHYGAETTLARKFSALLKAMQLEIGCAGNPLNEGCDRFHCLATPSWIKRLWERLHFYHFSMHLDYWRLDMPRWNNALSVSMFWIVGFQDTQIKALNLCELVHRLLFLSDIANACGRALDLTFLVPPAPDTILESRSLFMFPNEQPSRAD